MTCFCLPTFKSVQTNGARYRRPSQDFLLVPGRRSPQVARFLLFPLLFFRSVDSCCDTDEVYVLLVTPRRTGHALLQQKLSRSAFDQAGSVDWFTSYELHPLSFSLEQDVKELTSDEVSAKDMCVKIALRCTAPLTDASLSELHQSTAFAQAYSMSCSALVHQIEDLLAKLSSESPPSARAEVLHSCSLVLYSHYKQPLAAVGLVDTIDKVLHQCMEASVSKDAAVWKEIIMVSGQ